MNRPKETLKRIATSVVFVCLCLYSMAQTDSVAHHLDEVVVSAVHTSDDVRSMAPQYSIESEDFTRLNITDMTSVLRHLPGVTLRDYGGAGGMKTVSVRGLGSQHTGISLDGLLLPDVQSGQIDLQQFQFSEITSLRLNIAGNDDIFLPARTQSRAAVLNIVTSDSLRNILSLTGGSWGYLSPSLMLGRRIGNVAVSLQGGYTRADNDYPYTVENGVATHQERRQNSRVKQGNVNASVLWGMSPETTLRTFLRLNDNDRQLPGLVHLYTNGNDETLRDKGILAQSQLSSRLCRSMWLKTALRWNWTRQDYHNGKPSGGIQSERYIQRECYATASLLWQMTGKVSCAYSVDYFHNSMATTLSANPHPHRNTLLQSISGKWTDRRLNIVTQMLNTNIAQEHRLSPSVSASYRLLADRDLFLRLSAKSIFRMPSMTELYYYRIGSLSLQPETTSQLDLGVTVRLPEQGRWQGSLACDAYINKVSDKIVCIPFNMFVSQYMNIGKTHGVGVVVSAEASYALSPSSSLRMDANYSCQRIGNYTTDGMYRGYQIAYMPEHSGQTTFSWQNPWVNIATTMVYASETWTTNEHHAGTRIAGYYELAASVSKQIGRLTCSLSVQNLLDKCYCIIAHYPMPGRSFRVNVEWELKN